MGLPDNFPQTAPATAPSAYNWVHLSCDHQQLLLTTTSILASSLHITNRYSGNKLFLLFGRVCLVYYANPYIRFSKLPLHNLPDHWWGCDRVALHLVFRPIMEIQRGGPAIECHQQEQEKTMAGENSPDLRTLTSSVQRSPTREIACEEKIEVPDIPHAGQAVVRSHMEEVRSMLIRRWLATLDGEDKGFNLHHQGQKIHRSPGKRACISRRCVTFKSWGSSDLEWLTSTSSWRYG